MLSLSAPGAVAARVLAGKLRGRRRESLTVPVPFTIAAIPST
jgi:hypothetical protein